MIQKVLCCEAGVTDSDKWGFVEFPLHMLPSTTVVTPCSLEKKKNTLLYRDENFPICLSLIVYILKTVKGINKILSPWCAEAIFLSHEIENKAKSENDILTFFQVWAHCVVPQMIEKAIVDLN